MKNLWRVSKEYFLNFEVKFKYLPMLKSFDTNPRMVKNCEENELNSCNLDASN